MEDTTSTVSHEQSWMARFTSSRRRRGGKQTQNLAGWLFSSPWLIIFLLFMLGPILLSLVMSFTSFGLFNLQDPLSSQFVGLANYSRLLTDPIFWKALGNTAYFVVVGVPLDIILSLLVAMGVNRGIGAFKTIFRVGYYLPVVTAIVAVAVIWRFLLSPDSGLINNLLAAIHINGPNWLGSTALAMPSIILLAVWRNIGSAMIILLAGLQGIDASYYEAAHVDGANAFNRFWSITLPMLRPTLLFVTVITSIGFLQVFAEPFVMTNGGPLNSTLTISMYLYQQGFNYFHQGYASAIAYVLFIIIVVLSVVQFRLLQPQD
jgi:ABC-type sugar transport systems, permease components